MYKIDQITRNHLLYRPRYDSDISQPVTYDNAIADNVRQYSLKSDKK